jgi:hypothetical protein
LSWRVEVGWGDVGGRGFGVRGRVVREVDWTGMIWNKKGGQRGYTPLFNLQLRHPFERL